MFLHTITLCLATTLHGTPATTCGTIEPNITPYPTAAECITTLPEVFVHWWNTDAKLLKILPTEIADVGCQKLALLPTTDND